MTRRPGITLLAVCSIALALGFSTAAFSVLDAYALRDLPVRQPRQLAWLGVTTQEGRPENFTWIESQAIASRSHSFSGLLAQSRQGPRVRLPDHDDFPITAGVSDNFFDLLGVKAAFGDVFHVGRGQDGTVVITRRYWERELKGDAAALGRLLPVGRGQLKIIGVLPEGFTGTNRGLAVDLFVPPQTFFGALAMAHPNDVRFTDYELLGRLRPGVTPEAARVEIDSILRQVAQDGLAPSPNRKSGTAPFTESSVLAKLETNMIFLSVMGLLILIAAANLVNLRLVDQEARRRETGIRMALGAGRALLARQHLAETLLLSGTGAALGVLLAGWLVHALPALLYGGRRFTDFDIRLSANTLAFSTGALLCVALMGTLIPFSDSTKRRIVPMMQSNRSTRPTRWLTLLVVAQLAVVTAVTCTAGLLWRSLQNVSAIRPAMDPERNLLLVQGFWPSNRESTIRTEETGAQLAALPGVAHVAWARRALLSGSGGGAIVDVEVPRQPKLSFRYDQVSPDYFATTGARVIRGRPFTAGDGPSAAPVLMVNASFVRHYFPSAEVLGTWIRVNGRDRQIVGVVEDGPTIHLREKLDAYLYFPFAQMPSASATFFIQSRADAGRLADAVRPILRRDQTFITLDIITMRQFMRNAHSEEQVAAEVTGTLAAVGLVLAAAGLFGVTLFSVARRLPEFGVRMAVGATPAALLRQVLREAGWRIAAALPVGWALAYGGRRALEKLLYGVAPDDLWSFAFAGGFVALIACLAALYPAARAAGSDPLVALRHE